MPLIHESVVFQTTYDIIKNFHSVRRAFDKGERYSLGEKTENSLLEILIFIIEAGNARHGWKINAIDAALHYLEKSKVLIRLARDLEQIREKNYLDLEENLNKIGRMLGGWRKVV
jgi:hypothetical protein